MLRTILLFIAFVVLIAVALVWTGVINLNRNANGSVSIETRDVQVGTTTKNVQVPVVKTETRQVEVPSVAVSNGQSNAQ
jgi:preprotein translocase subunit SecF